MILEIKRIYLLEINDSYNNNQFLVFHNIIHHPYFSICFMLLCNVATAIPPMMFPAVMTNNETIDLKDQSLAIQK